MGTPLISFGKYFYLFFLFNCYIACVGYKPAYLKLKDEAGKRFYKNKKDFFKEYALCSCLLQNLPLDSLGLEGASKNVYYNLSDDDLQISDIGRKIDSNVYSYFEHQKTAVGVTYENKKTPFFNCIMYYKSSELDNFISNLIYELKKKK